MIVRNRNRNKESYSELESFKFRRHPTLLGVKLVATVLRGERRCCSQSVRAQVKCRVSSSPLISRGCTVPAPYRGAWTHLCTGDRTALHPCTLLLTCYTTLLFINSLRSRRFDRKCETFQPAIGSSQSWASPAMSQQSSTALVPY